MLTADVKRTINNARDILVGKVPDPKSQVDLITVAMIYKFMDDMDRQGAGLSGGTRNFFKDDLEQYAFSKLMDVKLGAQERMNLYAEALDKLPLAQNVPELFRKIFKGAFLPFRDPNTLTLFLKEISNFSYDNSENLGNAFEYLLSIMGSQGDAGQFRTPRHIIDFIVDVVNPTKTDTILDPACGTAGFLISAYLHIMEENAKTPLTAKEHRTLTENMIGYDISPDMVKLATVNMYLHRFNNPKIYEYDTLSSDYRWNENFDVILANPPFMTPKGGIQPHKKFSVNANRSEVLFVDYIAEHLTANGRAGIIVPEGVIFQSATAYKQLRKILVDDNYLYAVVSLPGGVFNPYAGVKTSILFFDRALAKQKKDILFVKIENDGFDLGAQRKPITANDLPTALEIINKYKNNEDLSEYTNALVVTKEKIGQDGDYNLTGSRYIANEQFGSDCKYEFAELGSLCEILDSRRKPVTKSDRIAGVYPYYGATGILDYVSDYIFDERCVLIGEDGAKWESGAKTAFIAEGKYWVNNHCHIIKPDPEKVIDTYIVSIINSMDLTPLVSGGVIPKLTQKDLRGIKIPLPPMEIQKQIVAEIENKQSIIDNTRETLANLERERAYFNNLLDGIESDFVAIGDDNYFTLESGGTPSTTNSEYWGGDIAWISLIDLPANSGITNIITTERTITEAGIKNSSAKILPVNTIVVSTRATIGRVGITKIPLATNQGFKNIIIKDPTKANPVYIANAVAMLKNQMEALASGGTFKEISKSNMATLKIPLPSLVDQERIVAALDEEQKMVESNKALIDLMQKKIDNVIKRIYKCDA